MHFNLKYKVCSEPGRGGNRDYEYTFKTSSDEEAKRIAQAYIQRAENRWGLAYSVGITSLERLAGKEWIEVSILGLVPAVSSLENQDRKRLGT